MLPFSMRILKHLKSSRGTNHWILACPFLLQFWTFHQRHQQWRSAQRLDLDISCCRCTSPRRAFRARQSAPFLNLFLLTSKPIQAFVLSASLYHSFNSHHLCNEGSIQQTQASSSRWKWENWSSTCCQYFGVQPADCLFWVSDQEVMVRSQYRMVTFTSH